MVAPLTTSSAAFAPVKPSALADWISHLRILMPPEGLVHVGAGDGVDLPDYAAWGMKQVVLVEADEANAKRLTERARPHAGWQVHHGLVVETDGDAIFYVASNPRESGLIPAEALRPLWRNLKATAERPMAGVSLDNLLAACGASGVDWLVVDCLPAAALVRGAAHLVAHCDVVLVRAAACGSELQGLANSAQLEEIAALLGSYGLKQVAIEEERMPLVVRALFVRPPARGLQEKIACLEESQVEISRLNSDLNALREAAAKSDVVLRVTREERDEFEQRLVDATKVRENLESEAEALRKLACDQVVIAEELATARAQLLALQQSESAIQDDFARERAVMQSQLQTLEQQASDVHRQKMDLEAQCSAAQHSSDEARAHLTRLQGELEEQYRLRLATEQIVCDKEKSYEQLQAELGICHEKIATIERQHQLLQESIESRQARVLVLEQEKHAVESSLALTQNHVRHVEAERDSVKDQFASLHVAHAEKEGHVARMVQENSQLMDRLKEYQRQVTGAERSKRHFDIEMAKAEAQIALIRDVLIRPEEKIQTSKHESNESDA